MSYSGKFEANLTQMLMDASPVLGKGIVEIIVWDVSVWKDLLTEPDGRTALHKIDDKTYEYIFEEGNIIIREKSNA